MTAIALTDARPACAYLVTWTTKGLVAPRPCTQRAKGGPYCGLHALVAARVRAITVHDGGWCVWCAAPARAYVRDGVTIALCAACSRALSRAIREGR
jgi:hypothetical protein